MIQALVERARDFQETIRQAKRSLGPVDFEWYPYDTLSALGHLNHLLTGPNRALLSAEGGGRRIADLGCGDGELAFFFASLGYQVVAVDHPLYNHNGMRGARALKSALGSQVELAEIDLDRPFRLPHESYDVAFFLGILYHLRSPFPVLEELAKRASWCFVSTRIARCFPGGKAMPAGAPLAYLVDETELNNDESNYFIFSEPGLRTLLKRTYWEVCDFVSTGHTARSEPVRLDRDERAFCLARSRYDRLSNLELLEGWHASEGTGWRWTQREFRARVKLGRDRRARVLVMQLFLPDELLERFGVVTLEAAVNGRPLAPARFERAGPQTLVRPLGSPSEPELELDFRTSGVLEPDARDGRERGIVVVSIMVE